MRAGQDRPEVGGGEDGHYPRQCLSLGGVQTSDSSMRVWAAHHGHAERARSEQILGVAPSAGDQARVLAAMDLGADQLCDRHDLSPPGGSGRDRDGRASLDRLTSRLDRANDVRVARAAAQVALQAFAYLRVARPRIALQQRRGGHEETGCAEAALQPVLVPECLLQRVQLAVGGQSLDGPHMVTIDLDGEYRARLDGPVVQQHRACPALAGIAANVRACQAELLAQEVHEQVARLDVTRVAGPVDSDADMDPVSHSASLERCERRPTLAAPNAVDRPELAAGRHRLPAWRAVPLTVFALDDSRRTGRESIRV